MGLTKRSSDFNSYQMPKVMPSELKTYKLTKAFLRPAYSGTSLEHLSKQFKNLHNID